MENTINPPSKGMIAGRQPDDDNLEEGIDFDAGIEFLDSVKGEFGSDSFKYRKVHDVLNKYWDSQLQAPQAIQRIALLFHDCDECWIKRFHSILSKNDLPIALSTTSVTSSGGRGQER